MFARDLVLLALLATLLWPSASRRRLGLSLVGSLTTAAAAATVAAGAGFAAQNSLEHSGLLQESGVASNCDVRPASPMTNSGTVAYRTTGFTNTSGHTACFTVAVQATRRSQLFSAAYLGSFDPKNAARGYLGDAGRCTNTVGAAGPTVGYSIRVPARARFAVEVEPCNPGNSMPPYSLQVSERHQ